MAVRGLVLGVFTLALPGCFGLLEFDKDKDGLSNKEEEELGTNPEVADSDGDAMIDGDEIAVNLDPLNPDTDGDRLLDGHEAANGADPFVQDTDGDGYFDGDEVAEGHNPADKSDKIYKGKWPYYYGKEELKEGPKDFFDYDKRFARLQMVDQHGETVDLYDFYNSDKPVVIEISGEWCYWCHVLTEFLVNGYDSQGFYEAAWPGAPEAIANGDVYWITILDADSQGLPADLEVAQRWEESYPSKQIPILTDSSYAAINYVGLNFYPSVILLTPELKVRDTGSFGDATSVLATLAAEVD